MAGYDWSKLKSKFVLGDYASLKDFAERENVPYNYLRLNAVGWVQERKAKRKQKTNEIIEKTTARQIEKEVDLNTRVLSIAERFLKVLGSMSDKELKTKLADAKEFTTLTKGLDNLQKIHRLSEGLDKKDQEDAEAKLAAVLDDMSKAFKS